MIKKILRDGAKCLEKLLITIKYKSASKKRFWQQPKSWLKAPQKWLIPTRERKFHCYNNNRACNDCRENLVLLFKCCPEYAPGRPPSTRCRFPISTVPYAITPPPHAATGYLILQESPKRFPITIGTFPPTD